MIKYYDEDKNPVEGEGPIAKVVTYGPLGEFVAEVMQCAEKGYKFSDLVDDYPRQSVGQFQATFRMQAQIQAASTSNKRKTKQE